jgi:hypothetical protein
MDAERKARLDALVAKELDASGDLAPPWARHPEIPAGSIGWRMGAGEGWLLTWHHWLATQPPHPAARIEYLRRHPPAPRTWQDLAIRVVHPEWGEDDELERQDEVVRELEALGIVADDAAFGAWLARNDPPKPPWAPERTAASTVRYGSRELGFFVRWALLRREGGTLATWLESVGRPVLGWRAVIAALETGVVPEPMPSDPRELLAALLAATGDPPPPWSRGERTDSLGRLHEEKTTYAGAWAEWAMASFDDVATWRAYLGRCAPAPPEWDATVRRKLSWLFR